MGSKAARLAGDVVSQFARASPVESAPIATAIKTVAPRVHMVERTVRSFVHSERSSPTMP
jgi:hypothetical protein